MNKLLIILSLCFVFAGELEVDGDLKVTGNIEAGTIDSLQQVIAGLQAQIAALQVDNRLETRVFEIEYVTNGTTIDFDELLGYNFNYFILEILNATPVNWTPTESYSFRIENSLFDHFGKARGYYYAYNLNTFTWDGAGDPRRGLFIDNGEDIIFTGVGNWSLTIAVTADFANAPTYQAPDPPQNSRTAQ